MSVKHSWAGSRLIHAGRCVGQALEGPIGGPRCSILVHSIPVHTPKDRSTTMKQAWENLSPAIIVYLSPGSLGPRYVPVTRPVPPVEDCLLCELNEPKAIKIPSVLFADSSVPSPPLRVPPFRTYTLHLWYFFPSFAGPFASSHACPLIADSIDLWTIAE